MKKKLSISLLCILAIITQTASAKADVEKMNVAPNHSFEDDLAGIQTNVCVFGGWFPIGVVVQVLGQHTSSVEQFLVRNFSRRLNGQSEHIDLLAENSIKALRATVRRTDAELARR